MSKSDRAVLWLERSPVSSAKPQIPTHIPIPITSRMRTCQCYLRHRTETFPLSLVHHDRKLQDKARPWGSQLEEVKKRHVPWGAKGMCFQSHPSLTSLERHFKYVHTPSLRCFPYAIWWWGGAGGILWLFLRNCTCNKTKSKLSLLLSGS